MSAVPTDEQYQRLLTFRTRLREFDRWSRAAARERGLTHSQHQLLLAIRGGADPAGPTVGEVAAHLLIKHHTATELVDRVHDLGLVDRVTDPDDHRRVRLRLTDRGHAVLTELTEVHLDELRHLSTWLGDI